jgi:hypothetical protein
VPISVLAKQLVKNDPNLSRIDAMAELGMMREKQIEKAQRMLLTKLTSNDYLAQQIIMTPEQQRVSW